MAVEFELPWPPSVNHYYRHVGPRVLISRDGREYRETIVSLLGEQKIRPFENAVELAVDAYPPDNRRRDVDNLLKCLLDSFTFGGLYRDDSQIKKLTITKREPMPPGGMMYIRIKEYEETPDKARAGPHC